MTKPLILAFGLLISLGASAVSDMTDIIDYANRTAKDYCSPKNVVCINEFSNQVIVAYKDGQMDAGSRFRENTLSRRYENKLMNTECIKSDDQYKKVCASMVDRLVDSYNRGLNSK